MTTITYGLLLAHEEKTASASASSTAQTSKSGRLNGNDTVPYH
jgi:hypothetical protein